MIEAKNEEKLKQRKKPKLKRTRPEKKLNPEN
jgi:hypothetical protein